MSQLREQDSHVHVPDDFGENRFGIPEYANGEIVSHG